MSLELATVNSTTLTFKSKELLNSAKKIVSLMERTNSNNLSVIFELGKVFSSECYKEDYEKFESFTEEVFGIKKAQAYNMVRVGNKWLQKVNNKVVSVLPRKENDPDYSATKLLTLERYKVDVDTAKQWAEDGEISPYMTVSELSVKIELMLETDENESDSDVEEGGKDDTIDVESEEKDSENIDRKTYLMWNITVELGELCELEEVPQEVKKKVEELLESAKDIYEKLVK